MSRMTTLTEHDHQRYVDVLADDGWRPTNLICPDCGQVIYRNDETEWVENGLCPNCKWRGVI